jgi:N-acyl-L-homoserine lactone synthetase
MKLDAAVDARSQDDAFAPLLEGYRFRLCLEPAETAAALDVRRQVYVGGSGYDIPVPDEYDRWSWFITAEDTNAGKVVGSMRLTPRWAGPFEAEEYFTLPAALRAPTAVEINRFAILPEYRKGKTFLPIVSVGMFKLLYEYLLVAGASAMVICSKAERIWTYEWLRFRRTGLKAPYGKLGAAEHELLVLDVARAPDLYAGHPFYEFFEPQRPQIEVPDHVPAVGIGVPPVIRRIRRSA